MTTVFYFNLCVGSGIEKIGNYVGRMLNEIGFDVIEYKDQNPPYILAQALAEADPDVIIMNEFYPRLIRASYYHKVYNPDCRVILVNHTNGALEQFPLDHDKEFGVVDRDGVVCMNNAMFNSIDWIVNLDWKPRRLEFESAIQRKVTSVLFPVDYNEFYPKVEWKDRKHDFLYFGNVLPHKLSERFLRALKGTGLTLDIFGKLFPEQHPEYVKLIETIPEVKYHGYCPQGEVLNVMNGSRFFISARGGPEPFMMTMAEVIMAGCIPLVQNDRTKPRADWIDHYKDLYVEYQTIPELINAMKMAKTKHDDPEFVAQLNEKSTTNSIEMAKRCSWERVRNVLRAAIHDDKSVLSDPFQ